MIAADEHHTGDDLRRQFREQAWPLLPVLLRVARMLTGNAVAAEDLVQETMMRAYRHLHSFEPGTHMKAWLLTILRRTRIDMHRHDSRRINAASLEALELEPTTATEARRDADHAAWADPDALLDRFEDEAIEAAVRALPEAMRWTLLLIDVEQLSVSEAASILGTAQGTVKSRASRARAQLRAALLPEARRRGYVPARPPKPPTGEEP